jgi:hypothetical protein
VYLKSGDSGRVSVLSPSFVPIVSSVPNGYLPHRRCSMNVSVSLHLPRPPFSQVHLDMVKDYGSCPSKTVVFQG